MNTVALTVVGNELDFSVDARADVKGCMDGNLIPASRHQ